MRSWRTWSWTLPAVVTTLVFGGMILGVNPLKKMARVLKALSSKNDKRLPSDENQTVSLSDEHLCALDKTTTPRRPGNLGLAALPTVTPRQGRPPPAESTNQGDGKRSPDKDLGLVPRVSVLSVHALQENFHRVCRAESYVYDGKPTAESFIPGPEIVTLLLKGDDGLPVELGRGQCGAVYLGYHELDRKLLMIKTFFKKSSSLNSIIKEAALLQCLCRASDTGCDSVHLALLEETAHYGELCIISGFLGDPTTPRAMLFWDVENKSEARLDRAELCVQGSDEVEIRTGFLELLFQITYLLRDFSLQ